LVVDQSCRKCREEALKRGLTEPKKVRLGKGEDLHGDTSGGIVKKKTPKEKRDQERNFF